MTDIDELGLRPVPGERWTFSVLSEACRKPRIPLDVATFDKLLALLKEGDTDVLSDGTNWWTITQAGESRRLVRLDPSLRPPPKDS